MPRWLEASNENFNAELSALLEERRKSVSQKVDAPVAKIINDVRCSGISAVISATAKFDEFQARVPEELRVPPEALLEALESLPDKMRDALELAASRIQSFHERQLPTGFEYTDDLGVKLGMRWTAINAVGLYVPGGAAAYPSSVLMNAIPAKVAGVERLVITAPTPRGKDNSMVLAAAALAGVDEVWRIGGAQAIAALAYGADPIFPVDKIVGPGNAYVAEAKRQVFGQVGIDMIAGPSEVLVVADKSADPRWLAIDLLAQAEHDTDAQSIIISDSVELLKSVQAAVEQELKTLPRSVIAGASWNNHGGLIRASLEATPQIIDRIAPEHLELAIEKPAALADRVQNAGSIFIGTKTPEAIGDYIGGPNHVLPTSGAARFSSGLGVIDFMKRTTLLGCGDGSLSHLGPHAITLADSEGLDAHARSIAVRLS